MTFLSGISLSLLHLLEGLHRSVQRMSVVSSELGVGTLERGISVGLWLLDAVLKRNTLVDDVHKMQASNPAQIGSPTRFGEPSWLGCAETSSWILAEVRRRPFIFLRGATYWPSRRYQRAMGRSAVVYRNDC